MELLILDEDYSWQELLAVIMVKLGSKAIAFSTKLIGHTGFTKLLLGQNYYSRGSSTGSSVMKKKEIFCTRNVI